MDEREPTHSNGDEPDAAAPTGVTQAIDAVPATTVPMEASRASGVILVGDDLGAMDRPVVNVGSRPRFAGVAGRLRTRSGILAVAAVVALIALSAWGWTTSQDLARTRADLSAATADLAATRQSLSDANASIAAKDACLTALTKDRADLASLAQDMRSTVLDRMATGSTWDSALSQAEDSTQQAFKYVLQSYSDFLAGSYFSAELEIELATPLVQTYTDSRDSFDAQTLSLQSAGSSLAGRLEALNARIRSDVQCSGATGSS